MANKKFVVALDGAERARLDELISKGKAPARTILKARILLQADQGEGGEAWTDARICEALDTSMSTVSRAREKLVGEGLDAVLARKKRATPPVQPIFDGAAQAKLTALARQARRPKASRAGRSACWPSTSSSAESCRPRTSIQLAVR